VAKYSESSRQLVLKSLHSRRSVIKHGAIALGALALPVWPQRAAKAQSTTFDYYISPSGSDSNPGTQAEPWAITAINTKQSMYAGKKVGLLDGTYLMYSMLNGGSYLHAALLVNGSTDPKNPTLIQAVNPRMAILDGHQAPGTPGTGYPSGTAAIIGVGQGDTPPILGNVVIDGLVVTGSNTLGIHFFCKGANTITAPAGQNYSGRSYGGATGIVVRNCEVYDIYSTNFGNNPHAVGADYVTGMLVQNCKIHPMWTMSSPEVQGILTFNTNESIYEYNTIYACGSAIEEKEGPQGGTTVRYNYLEGADSNLGTIRDMSGGILGMTTTFHHNVVVGPTPWNNNDSTNLSEISQENLICYNNTFYYGGGNFPSFGVIWKCWGSAGPTSPLALETFYNNIYYCTGNGPTGADVGLTAGAFSLSDYNSYRPASATTSLLYTFAEGGGSEKGYTLSGWQRATSQDAHSITVNPNFVNPKSANPIGYQLQGTYGNLGTSPCSGAGRVGGIPAGARCNMGAWDGSVTQIGCDFNSTIAADASSANPSAPVLSII
jgi:hypothetical protein